MGFNKHLSLLNVKNLNLVYFVGRYFFVQMGPFVMWQGRTCGLLKQKYSQTSLIRPSLIQLFANPAKNLLEQIFPY